ncbi:MAG: hypothetical protein Q7T73_17085, partial [Beijerinckiaceae bacterium]|nr:hypothetical protein [Beijerinckiaceae bacterium]
RTHMTSAGHQGWMTLPPLSSRRVGLSGPDKENPLKDSPHYWALKVRTGGPHAGHVSLMQWFEKRGCWMLLVLDESASTIGQTFGETQGLCNARMNDVYAAKGLGIYSGKTTG